MKMWHWGYGSWWMGLMMMLFWGLVLAGIIWALRVSTRDAAPRASSPRSMDILSARYARGEIDDDEYARRRRQLEDADI